MHRPSIPQETLRELVHLRERVADLEAELAELKNTKREDELRLRAALGTGPGVTRTLLALTRGGIMSREQLLHHGCANGEDNGLRLVDSQIKRIRRRLPWIKIRSHYGYGYELAPESIKEIRSILSGGQKRVCFAPSLVETTIVSTRTGASVA